MRIKFGTSWCAAIYLVLAGCGGSSIPDTPEKPSVAEVVARYQVASKHHLEDTLKDGDSAKYDDVKAYRVDLPNGDTVYAFCGRVNAKNGFGGYGGFERFVAAPAVSVLESQTSDFNKIVGKFCDPAKVGPAVWW